MKVLVLQCRPFHFWLCIVRVVEFKRTSFLILLSSTASLCTVSILCEYTFFVRKYVRRHYYVHWLFVCFHSSVFLCRTFISVDMNVRTDLTRSTAAAGPEMWRIFPAVFSFFLYLDYLFYCNSYMKTMIGIA